MGDIDDTTYEQKKQYVIQRFGTRPLHLSNLVESTLSTEEYIRNAITKQKKYLHRMNTSGALTPQHLMVFGSLLNSPEDRIDEGTFGEITGEFAVDSELVKNHLLDYDMSGTGSYFFWSKYTIEAAKEFLKTLPTKSTTE
jgi:hypothetical protein